MQTHKQGLLALVVIVLSCSLLGGCDKLSSESLLDPQNKAPLTDLTNQWVGFEFNGDAGKMTGGKNIKVYNRQGLLIYKGGLMNGKPKGDGIRYLYEADYAEHEDVYLAAYETVDDRKQGQCELYSVDFRCLLRTKYRKDRLHGPCEMTAPLKIKCYFLYGVQGDKYEERYNDGRRHIECRYHNGLKQRYVEYYHGGQKRYDLTLKGPLNDGTFAVMEGKEYYENGQVSYKGEFSNPVRPNGILSFVEMRGSRECLQDFAADRQMQYHGPGTKYNEQGDKIYEGLWNSGKFSREAP